MSTILTLLLISGIAYWVMIIIARKKRELADKEILHKEQFLKETQSILKMETPIVVSTTPAQTLQSSTDHNFPHKVIEHFIEHGYSINESSKAEGIDFIGVKEKELLLIRSENILNEVKKTDLQLFIAECSVYIDHNPMLKSRSLIRVYATNRPITTESRMFLRENPASLLLKEDI